MDDKKKTCTGCHESKLLGEFYSRQSKCKPCFLLAQKESKARRAGGGPKRKAGRSPGPRRKVALETIAAPPVGQSPPPPLAVLPGGLGFVVSLEVNPAGTYPFDLVIGQATEAGDARIWLTPSETDRLLEFIQVMRSKLWP